MSELQVNSITDTGGHTLLGRRNAIINGNFDVWQRGTSQTVSGYGSADRWRFEIGTSTQSVTQQVFALGQTDVPYNPKYYYRNVVTTGGTASSYARLYQKIEGVGVFAGETVTLSFYAKADASKNIAVSFIQSFGTGGSPSSAVLGISPTTVGLTTSWAKYTVTIDVPSISGKTLGTDDNDSLGVLFWLDAGSDFNARTNSLGNQSGTFEFAQVQLEAGSVATPFERRSYGEELALCQRYYEQIDAEVPYPFIGPATGISTIYAMAPVYYAKKRVIPSISASGDFVLYDGADKTASAVDLQHTNTTRTTFRATSSGIVAGRSYKLQFQTAGDRCIKIDAEL